MARQLRLQKSTGSAAPTASPDDQVCALGLGEYCSYPAATLVLDLCNFTNIARTLDDFVTVPLLQEILSGLAVVVERHQGVINKFPGDGAMAFFPEIGAVGYNAAAQALRCAATALWWFYREMGYHERKLLPLPRASHRLALCAGVDYGSIKVALVGTPQQSEFILVGDSVNSAAKCQAAAAGGEVVVGSDARRHSALFSGWFSAGPRTHVALPTLPVVPYLSYRFAWQRAKASDFMPHKPTLPYAWAKAADLTRPKVPLGVPRPRQPQIGMPTGRHDAIRRRLGK